MTNSAMNRCRANVQQEIAPYRYKPTTADASRCCAKKEPVTQQQVCASKQSETWPSRGDSTADGGTKIDRQAAMQSLKLSLRQLFIDRYEKECSKESLESSYFGWTQQCEQQRRPQQNVNALHDVDDMDHFIDYLRVCKGITDDDDDYDEYDNTSHATGGDFHDSKDTYWYEINK